MEQLRQVVVALGGVNARASVPIPFAAKAFGEEGPRDAAAWDARFGRLFDEVEERARILRGARSRQEGASGAAAST